MSRAGMPASPPLAPDRVRVDRHAPRHRLAGAGRHPVTARLLRSVGANLYAQLVTALIQVTAVPVLLGLWGAERYGGWVLLSAVPTALAFADGGLVLATATAMTMAAGRQDTAVAAALYRRAVRVVGLTTLAAAVVASGLVFVAPAWLLGAGLTVSETRSLLPCFALITLAGLLGNLPGAAFQAGNRYAFGVSLGATLRAAETAAVLAAAALGDGLFTAAAAWLIVRALGVLLQFALARHTVPWLRRPSRRPAEAPRPIALLRPALAAVALPMGFAVSLQGVVLAAGLVLAPGAVAAFATARTLSRLVVQLAGLVNHALMPEMSRVAGRGDPAAAAAMVRFSRVASSAILLPGWLALLGVGPWLLRSWTGGRLMLPPAVLPLVATAALVHGLWLARANLLLAVNRQADYAWAFLAMAAFTAVVAALLGRYDGLVGVAAASLGGEVAMALWVRRVSRPRRLGRTGKADTFPPQTVAACDQVDAGDAALASDRPTVTAVLACHNRRAKTLDCLDALLAQDAACTLRVILFDDGSTDGTAAAVRARHPGVDILAGSGEAYWAGGMRHAFEAARAARPDFVLWLNDDVSLLPHALARLLSAYDDRARHGSPLCLIGGAVADPSDGRTTYAGIRQPHARRPLRFRHEPPHSSQLRRCDTLVGNVVLVPRLTSDTVGGLDPAFRHTLADLDYGLRVAAAGGWVGMAPGHLGRCVREAGTGRWFDPALPLRRRWRLLNHPLGLPPRPWLHFARRHGGRWWMLFAPLPYWRLFVPLRLARLVDRRLAPAPRTPVEVRHA